MIDDIVRRLRERADYSTMLACDPPRPAPDRLCHDAADEIARLQARVSELEREAATLAAPCQIGGCKYPAAQARIAALEGVLAAIKLLTSWSKKKTDHRLPVVKEAHELACAALAKGDVK